MTGLNVASLFGGLGLGFALVALAWLHRVQQSVHALPKPFWMGEWPPVRGGILDGAYRYDHLSLDGLDDDIAYAVLRLGLRKGESLELLPERTRLPRQATEQCARREDIQATCGIDVDASGVPNFCIQLVAHKTAPDRDGFSGRQAVRQPHHIVGIANDGPANQSCFAEVAIEPAGRSQPDAFYRDLQEAAIDDAHAETAIGVRLKASCVGAGDACHLPVIHLSITLVPKRDDAQTNAITPQRPPGIDDTKDGTERGTSDGQRAAPIDAAQPSGQVHSERSRVVAGASIAEGGAA